MQSRDNSIDKETDFILRITCFILHIKKEKNLYDFHN